MNVSLSAELTPAECPPQGPSNPFGSKAVAAGSAGGMRRLRTPPPHSWVQPRSRTGTLLLAGDALQGGLSRLGQLRRHPEIGKILRSVMHFL